MTISTYQKLDNPATTNPNQVMLNGTFNIKFVDPKNSSGISFLDGGFYSTMNQ